MIDLRIHPIIFVGVLVVVFVVGIVVGVVGVYKAVKRMRDRGEL